MPIPEEDTNQSKLAETVEKASNRTHSLAYALASELREQIDNGILTTGIRLPSVRQQATRCGLSNDTVLRAYDQLVTLGYLQSRRGSRFFVRTRETEDLNDSSYPSVTSSFSLQLGSERERIMYSSVSEELMCPGSGRLPLNWVNHGMLMEAINILKNIERQVICGFHDVLGLPSLREALSDRLAAQGITASPSQIITTAGASEALHLAIWSHLSPGDYVIVEDPRSFLHTERLLAHGVQLLPVPRLIDGPDIEILQTLCEKYKPKVFLCSSLLQNPTSTNLGLYKAHQILKLAESHGMVVFDDDTFGDLQPVDRMNNIARLAALDQLENVIHIGSFSKILGSGIRSGYLAASRERIEKMLPYKVVSIIQGSPITDAVICHLLVSGAYQNECKRIQTKLENTRKHIIARMNTIGCQTSSALTGMFLWVELGDKIKSKEITAELYKNKIIAAPGYLFSGANEYNNKMRFNISSTQKKVMDKIDEIIKRETYNSL